MPTSYKSVSHGGNSVFASSKLVAVPTAPGGAPANGDVVLVCLALWRDPQDDPVITAPGIFQELIEIPYGPSNIVHIYWARMAGGESGNWTFSWSSDQWVTAATILIAGALAVGDPVVNHVHEEDGFPSPTSTVPPEQLSTLSAPFLAQFVVTAGPTASTDPPDSFTEVADVDCIKVNYRIPGVVGLHTCTGSVVTGGDTEIIAVLAAVAPGSSAPIVDVGPDSWCVVGGAFGRIAQENDTGDAIVARAWTVESGPEEVGNVVATTDTCTWVPTMTGTYVLRYTATNGLGSGFDELSLQVGGAVEGPENSSLRGGIVP